MKKQFLMTILMALLLPIGLYAQSDDHPVLESGDSIFVFTETAPQFPGGMDSLLSFIQHNLQYPEIARVQNIQGNLFVRFVVEKDGSLSSFQLIRDIGGGCGEEALRVLKLMPHWTPATLQGKAVRSSYTLPFKFLPDNPASQQSSQLQEVQQPEYPGGEAAFYQDLNKHLKYPKQAKDNNKEGLVFVEFVVNKKGKITDIRILQDNVGYGADKSVIKALKHTKCWTPAHTLDGRPLRCQFALPLTFKLH